MILEIISTLIFILFLVLELKQLIWCWPVGIVASSIFLYTQWRVNLLGMVALSFFLILSSIWAWYQWGKVNASNQEVVQTHRATKQEWTYTLVASTAISVLIYFLLLYFNSTSPLYESMIFTLNIVGTILLGKKSMAAWITLGIANLLCVLMYLITGSYTYAGLYVIYSIAAVLGWYSWSKIMIETKPS